MVLKTGLRRFAGLFRFFGLWIGFSGIYTMLSNTCPCCGRPGCPVGLGVAGIFGALGSFLILKGRTLLKRLFWRLRLIKPQSE
ncbi:MAG: hypothetical protein ACUVUR_05380 [bacterium]